MHYHHRPGLASCLALLIAAAATCARADVLHLTNGDRLTGRLVGMTEGVAVFQTDYAGELRISKDSILAIESEEALNVKLSDGEHVCGRFVFENETQSLVLGDVARTVTAAQVVGISTETAPLEDMEVADSTAEAEVEIEKKWSGRIAAGTSWRSGTTETLDANAALTLVRKWPDNVLTFDVSGLYGMLDSEVNTRKAAGEVKWQHYYGERAYFYGLTGAEHDEGRKLRLRLRGAGGVGYDFIKNEERKLSMDLGLGYAEEWWKEYDLVGARIAKDASKKNVRARILSFVNGLTADTDLTMLELLDSSSKLANDLNNLWYDNETTTQHNVNLRASGHYEQKVFEKSLLSENLTLEPRLDEFGEYRVLSDVALTTPLSNGLNLRLNLKTEYDSDVGDTDANKWDNTLLSSLEYKF